MLVPRRNEELVYEAQIVNYDEALYREGPRATSHQDEHKQYRGKGNGLLPLQPTP